jgi:hypothetical protein
MTETGTSGVDVRTLYVTLSYGPTTATSPTPHRTMSCYRLERLLLIRASSSYHGAGAVDFGVRGRSFNGWSLSYIESLDTLWLMGLYEEFDGALAVIANTTFSLPPVSVVLDTPHCATISDMGMCLPRIDTRDSLRPSFAISVGCYPDMPSLMTPSSFLAPTTWAPHFCQRSTPPPACRHIQSTLLMDNSHKGGLG